jgi:flagellar hook-associated protein 1 FlgK
MATIGTAFNIATGALDANQAALDIVANNTANVNTPGYTLETPTLETADSATVGGVRFGMGVEMTGAQSQRDRVLEQAVQQQTQTESGSAARLTALNETQALFTGATSAGTAANAASGIGSDLSNFFDSLASLEADPAQVAARQSVLGAAGTLASDFNSAAAQLESQRQSLDAQSTSVASQANTLLGTIAQLNVQIESQSPNADAGTLEDQRQQDLTNLSQLIGIRTVPTEDNGLTVTTMGGALLVSGGQAAPLTTGEIGGVTHFFSGEGTDITADLTSGGGQMGGILTARDQFRSEWQCGCANLQFAKRRDGCGRDRIGGADCSSNDRCDSAWCGGAGGRAVGQHQPGGDGQRAECGNREWNFADRVLLRHGDHTGESDV